MFIKNMLEAASKENAVIFYCGTKYTLKNEIKSCFNSRVIIKIEIILIIIIVWINNESQAANSAASEPTFDFFDRDLHLKSPKKTKKKKFCDMVKAEFERWSGGWVLIENTCSGRFCPVP